MPLELDAVVRALNVHMPAPIGWFTRRQLGDWMENHGVTITDGAADCLDGMTIAVIIPYEHRSLSFVVPALGTDAEMPRHHVTQFMAEQGLTQPYKAACQGRDGKRFQLMLYGPEGPLKPALSRKKGRDPAAPWPPPEEIPDGHELRGFAFEGDSPRDISHKLKRLFPSALVFVQNGYFYEAFDSDASACAEIFGWNVADHGNDGKFTGVPIRAQRFKQELRQAGRPYIIVLQQEYPAPDGPIVRQVHEVFSV